MKLRTEEEPPIPPSWFFTPHEEPQPVTDTALTARIMFFLQALPEQRPGSEELDHTMLHNLRLYLPADAPHWQTLAERIAPTLATLLKRAQYGAEVERHINAILSARHDRKYHVVFLWYASLMGVAAWGTENEETVLNILPRLLYLDRKFFLARSWVQESLAAWQYEGAAQKIQCAFFGNGDNYAQRYHAILTDLGQQAQPLLQGEDQCRQKDETGELLQPVGGHDNSGSSILTRHLNHYRHNNIPLEFLNAYTGLERDEPEAFFDHVAMFPRVLLNERWFELSIEKWWHQKLSNDTPVRRQARKNLIQLGKALARIVKGRVQEITNDEREAIVASCEKWFLICQCLNEDFKKVWEIPEYSGSEHHRKEVRQNLAEKYRIPPEDVEAIEWSLNRQRYGKKTTPWQAMLHIVARKHLPQNNPAKIRGEKTIENIYREGKNK